MPQENLDEKIKVIAQNEKYKDKIEQLRNKRHEYFMKKAAKGDDLDAKDDYKSKVSKKGDIVVFEKGTMRGFEDCDDTIKLVYLLENDIDHNKKELARLDQMLKTYKGEKKVKGQNLTPDDIEQNAEFQKLRLKSENMSKTIDWLRGMNTRMENQLNEQTKKYAEESQRNIELEDKLLNIGDNDIDFLHAEIRKKKSREKELENNLKALCENPFLKGTNERVSLAQKLRDTESQVIELRAKLQANKSYEQESTDSFNLLKAELEKLQATKEKINLDQVEMITRQEEEQRKNGGQFQKPEEKTTTALGAQMDQDQEKFREEELEKRRKMELERERLYYFGNTLQGRDEGQQRELGVNIDSNEGKGWYRMKLIDRKGLEQQKLVTKDDIINEIENLILEKGELASDLEKSETQLNVHMEMEKERQYSKELGIKKLDLQLKEATDKLTELQLMVEQKMATGNFQHYDENDVDYDDNVDVFSVTESQVMPGNIPGKSQLYPQGGQGQSQYMGGSQTMQESTWKKSGVPKEDGMNEFDFILNGYQLDRNLIATLMQKKGHDQIYQRYGLRILFLLEFYLFDLENTPVYQQYISNVKFQSNYVVKVDRQFLRYCLEDGFRMEIHAMVDKERFCLGNVNIKLFDLLKRNSVCFEESRNLSAVIKKRVEINNMDLGIPIGFVNVSYRLRYPIGAVSKLFLTEIDNTIAISDDNNKFLKEKDPKRRLVVRITEGSGFMSHSAVYVTYSFLDNETYYTKTLCGINPQFNYTKMHELTLDKYTLEKFKKTPLELQLIDDSVPYHVAETDNSDILGAVQINLDKLLVDNKMEETLKVIGQEKTYFLTIQLYLYDMKTTVPDFDEVHNESVPVEYEQPFNDFQTQDSRVFFPNLKTIRQYLKTSAENFVTNLEEGI